MLREEIYQKTATEFATPVGVASIIGYRTKSETVKEMESIGVKELNRDMDINGIITAAIQSGKYHQLSRGVWKLGKENRRLGERGLYIRVWKEINGKD